MTKLVVAEGRVLDRILDDTHSIWSDGLTRSAYGRFFAAQIGTPWGRTHLRRFALVDGDEVPASAKLYVFDAVLDGAPIRVAGLGAPRVRAVHFFIAEEGASDRKSVV